MRVLLKVSLVLSLVTLVAGPSLGQVRRGNFGPLGGATLLVNKSVQEELKLSAEQADRVKKVAQEIQDRYKDENDKLARERREYFAHQQQFLQKRSAAIHKSLTGSLTSAQLKRLKQIELQARGLTAFGDPEIQKALQLTEAQTKAIRTVETELRKVITRIIREDFGDPKKAREVGKKFATLARETQAKLVAQLSAKQKKAWQEMIGALFSALDTLPPGFFPFPPRGFNQMPGLLMSEKVQKELKLSDEQLARLKKAPEAFRDRYKTDIDELRRQQRQLFTRALALADKVDQDINKAVAGFLKPAQLKRLKQIEVQQLGVAAFADQKVQKALGLSAEQKKELRAIAENLRKRIVKARQEVGRDSRKRNDLDEQIRRITRDGQAQMVAQLNAEQQKTWKEMTGAPFELKSEESRPDPEKTKDRP